MVRSRTLNPHSCGCVLLTMILHKAKWNEVVVPNVVHGISGWRINGVKGEKTESALEAGDIPACEGELGPIEDVQQFER